MLVRSNAAALPGKAGLQGAVPHAQDPRPGLSACGLAGEGRAAGRGVHQDVAEQQAVEAAKHVHHTAGQQRRDVRRSEGFASAAFHKVSWEHNPTPARPPMFGLSVLETRIDQTLDSNPKQIVRTRVYHGCCLASMFEAFSAAACIIEHGSGRLALPAVQIAATVEMLLPSRLSSFS